MSVPKKSNIQSISSNSNMKSGGKQLIFNKHQHLFQQLHQHALATPISTANNNNNNGNGNNYQYSLRARHVAQSTELQQLLELEIQSSGVVTATGYHQVYQRFLYSDDVTEAIQLFVEREQQLEEIMNKNNKGNAMMNKKQGRGKDELLNHHLRTVEKARNKLSSRLARLKTSLSSSMTARDALLSNSTTSTRDQHAHSMFENGVQNNRSRRNNEFRTRKPIQVGQVVFDSNNNKSNSNSTNNNSPRSSFDGCINGAFESFKPKKPSSFECLATFDKQQRQQQQQQHHQKRQKEHREQQDCSNLAPRKTFVLTPQEKETLLKEQREFRYLQMQATLMDSFLVSYRSQINNENDDEDDEDDDDNLDGGEEEDAQQEYNNDNADMRNDGWDGIPNVNDNETVDDSDDDDDDEDLLLKSLESLKYIKQNSMRHLRMSAPPPSSSSGGTTHVPQAAAAVSSSSTGSKLQSIHRPHQRQDSGGSLNLKDIFDDLVDSDDDDDDESDDEDHEDNVTDEDHEDNVTVDDNSGDEDSSCANSSVSDMTGATENAADVLHEMMNQCEADMTKYEKREEEIKGKEMPFENSDYSYLDNECGWLPWPVDNNKNATNSSNQNDDAENNEHEDDCNDDGSFMPWPTSDNTITTTTKTVAAKSGIGAGLNSMLRKDHGACAA